MSKKGATRGIAGTHILLQIFLAVLKRRLPELRRHLRRRVVHDLPILPEEVPCRPGLLLRLLLPVGVPVGRMLGLRGYGGRR